MGVSGFQVALNHMRQVVVPSGVRIKNEVNAVRHAGIDIIQAVQGEENASRELHAILKERNVRRIARLRQKEIVDSKKEVGHLAHATRHYGLLIHELFQDFYILITLLKHMKDEGLHASKEPKERDLGNSILRVNRKVVRDLEPIFADMANMAQGVTNALKQLE